MWRLECIVYHHWFRFCGHRLSILHDGVCVLALSCLEALKYDVVLQYTFLESVDRQELSDAEFY
jgi:hypothetical protein